MDAVPAADIRKLRRLNNLSWLSALQSRRLAAALLMSRVAKREIIIDDKHSVGTAFVLFSGVAHITCRNRRGERNLVVVIAPGLIPAFPRPVPAISYSFRCEAITECQVGTMELKSFIEISLGIASDDFRRMVTSYLGRWDLVQTALRQPYELYAGRAGRVAAARTERELRRQGEARMAPDDPGTAAEYCPDGGGVTPTGNRTPPSIRAD